VDNTKRFADEVRANVECLKRDKAMHDSLIAWLTGSFAHRYSCDFAELGKPIIQYPQDVVAQSRSRPTAIYAESSNPVTSR
jgi:cephalosporin hydroxylase